MTEQKFEVRGEGTDTKGLLTMVKHGWDRAIRMAAAFPEDETLANTVESSAALYERLEQELDPEGWHILILKDCSEGRIHGERRSYWQVKTQGSPYPAGMLLDAQPCVLREHLMTLYLQANPHGARSDGDSAEIADMLAHKLRRKLGNVAPDVQVREGHLTITVPSALAEDLATLLLR